MQNGVISRAERPRPVLAVLATVVGAVTAAGTVALVVVVARVYGAADAIWVAAWFTPAIVGAVAAARRPGNAVGWLLLLIGFMGAASQAGFAYDPSPPLSIPEALVIAIATPLIYLAMAGLAVLIVVFPDGVPPRGPRRHIIQFVVVWLLVSATAAFLSPSLGGDARNYSNPLQIPVLHGFINAVGVASLVAAVVLLALAAGDAVRRQRRAHGIERQQFKWLAYAAALSVPALILTVSPAGNLWWSGIPIVVASNGLAASIGFAIVRYRLYDIDRIVSRTVAYLVVVGLLFGVYVACVLLMTTVLPLRGSISVVIAVLIAAGLFAPLRSRARALVDRRFNRSHYNAQSVVNSFAARLGDKVSLSSISSDLLSAVDQTVQPSHASLWLRTREPPAGAVLREPPGL
ncbi:MAG: hypothetical protein WBF51_03350 [Candidatus Dormiibacterota bacterium]